ncbi:MAG: hypothetical protein K2H39_08720, partial [Paramuribaculum sp.]|nr:hypothetical protein [Paramuribaculum sp.]
LRCVQSGSTGKVFKNNLGELFCINHGLLIPMNQGGTDYDILTEVVSVNDFTPVQNSCVEYFDSSVLTGEPLAVRKWQIGDRMKPFGMAKGSRLVSDIMRDAGYSLVDKDNTRLLVKGSEIIWVIGLRRSNLYRVNHDSSEIVKVTAVSKLSGS